MPKSQASQSGSQEMSQGEARGKEKDVQRTCQYVNCSAVPAARQSFCSRHKKGHRRSSRNSPTLSEDSGGSIKGAAVESPGAASRTLSSLERKTSRGRNTSATSQQGKGDVVWVPDEARRYCVGCSNKFGLARRKHHCRSCGEVVCHDCSNQRLVLGGKHGDKPVRVCNTCVATLQLQQGVDRTALLRIELRDGDGFVTVACSKDYTVSNFKDSIVDKVEKRRSLFAHKGGSAAPLFANSFRLEAHFEGAEPLTLRDESALLLREVREHALAAGAKSPAKLQSLRIVPLSPAKPTIRARHRRVSSSTLHHLKVRRAISNHSSGSIGSVTESPEDSEDESDDADWLEENDMPPDVAVSVAQALQLEQQGKARQADEHMHHHVREVMRAAHRKGLGSRGDQHQRALRNYTDLFKVRNRRTNTLFYRGVMENAVRSRMHELENRRRSRGMPAVTTPSRAPSGNSTPGSTSRAPHHRPAPGSYEARLVRRARHLVSAWIDLWETRLLPVAQAEAEVAKLLAHAQTAMTEGGGAARMTLPPHPRAAHGSPRTSSGSSPHGAPGHNTPAGSVTPMDSATSSGFSSPSNSRSHSGNMMMIGAGRSRRSRSRCDSDGGGGIGNKGNHNGNNSNSPSNNNGSSHDFTNSCGASEVQFVQSLLKMAHKSYADRVLMRRLALHVGTTAPLDAPAGNPDLITQLQELLSVQVVDALEARDYSTAVNRLMVWSDAFPRLHEDANAPPPPGEDKQAPFEHRRDVHHQLTRWSGWAVKLPVKRLWQICYLSDDDDHGSSQVMRLTRVLSNFLSHLWLPAFWNVTWTMCREVVAAAARVRVQRQDALLATVAAGRLSRNQTISSLDSADSDQVASPLQQVAASQLLAIPAAKKLMRSYSDNTLAVQLDSATAAAVAAASGSGRSHSLRRRRRMDSFSQTRWSSASTIGSLPSSRTNSMYRVSSQAGSSAVVGHSTSGGAPPSETGDERREREAQREVFEELYGSSEWHLVVPNLFTDENLQLAAIIMVSPLSPLRSLSLLDAAPLNSRQVEIFTAAFSNPTSALCHRRFAALVDLGVYPPSVLQAGPLLRDEATKLKLERGRNNMVILAASLLGRNASARELSLERCELTPQACRALAISLKERESGVARCRQVLKQVEESQSGGVAGQAEEIPKPSSRRSVVDDVEGVLSTTKLSGEGNSSGESAGDASPVAKKRTVGFAPPSLKGNEDSGEDTVKPADGDEAKGTGSEEEEEEEGSKDEGEDNDDQDGKEDSEAQTQQKETAAVDADGQETAFLPAPDESRDEALARAMAAAARAIEAAKSQKQQGGATATAEAASGSGGILVLPSAASGSDQGGRQARRQQMISDVQSRGLKLPEWRTPPSSLRSPSYLPPPLSPQPNLIAINDVRTGTQFEAAAAAAAAAAAEEEEEVDEVGADEGMFELSPLSPLPVAGLGEVEPLELTPSSRRGGKSSPQVRLSQLQKRRGKDDNDQLGVLAAQLAAAFPSLAARGHHMRGSSMRSLGVYGVGQRRATPGSLRTLRITQCNMGLEQVAFLLPRSVLDSTVVQGVETLDLSGNALDDQCMEALFEEVRDSWPHLTSLDLSRNPRVSDSGLTCLAGTLPRLTELNLADCPALTPHGVHNLLQQAARQGRLRLEKASLPPMSDAGMLALGALAPKLQELSIPGSQVMTDTGVVALVGACAQELRKVNLDNCQHISDHSLLALANCPHLSSLSARMCPRVTDEGVRALLGDMSRIKCLKELRLAKCSGVTNQSIGLLLQTSRAKLTALDVLACPVNERAVCVYVRCNPQLEELLLMGLKVTDFGDTILGAVAKTCAALRVLHLHHSSLTAAGVELVANACPQLEELGVGHCPQFGDEALRTLVKLQKLDKLYVNNCVAVSDEGLSSLADAPNRSVKVVTCQGCPGVTEHGVKSLQRAGIRVKI